MQIKWQPKAVIGRINAGVANLVLFLEVSGVKALVNHDFAYRLRVGDYRVLFNVHEQIEIISIEEVKKRDERTY